MPRGIVETEETFDLREYLKIFRRRWWVLVLGVVGGGLLALAVTLSTTPLFEATAKILVQGGRTPGLPTSGDIQVNQALAQQYVDLITTRPILERVIEQLSLSDSPESLSARIKLQSQRSLIEITATDPDPSLAARIANVTATTFIDDFRDRQLKQIAEFQREMSKYGITQDPNLIAGQAAALTTLSLVEEAVPPTSPTSPSLVRNVGFGAAIGLALAFVLVFVLELLDDRVRSPDDVRALLGLPTLGIVPRSQGAPYGGFVEAYRYLQANLEFADLDTKGIKSVAITSCRPNEGKTLTAVNLGITMAGEGKSVILVDADLRHPSLHSTFGVDRAPGLTHVLRGAAELDAALVATSTKNLLLLCAGPVPGDPAPVLRSAKMRALIGQLEERADIVILDTAPVLAVADPLTIAALVDGLLFVVDATTTRRQELKRGVETVSQATTSLLGIVLNKVPASDSGYYGYYYGYSEGTIGLDKGRSGWRSRLRAVVPRGR